MSTKFQRHSNTFQHGQDDRRWEESACRFPFELSHCGIKMENPKNNITGRSDWKGMLDPWKYFSPGLGVKNWTKFIWGEQQ